MQRPSLCVNIPDIPDTDGGLGLGLVLVLVNGIRNNDTQYNATFLAKRVEFTDLVECGDSRFYVGHFLLLSIG